MSFRTVVLSAALYVIGIAFAATVSAEAFARVPAGTTRLHHHYQHYNGQVRRPRILAMPPATVGRDLVGSPYCWPYDYTYDPYDYCGASYIVAW
jgi:hypothetical protein